MSVTSVSTAMYDFYSFFVVDQEARNQHMKIYTIAQEAFSSDKSFDSVMQLMGRALYVALDHIPVVSLVINEAAVFFGYDPCKILVDIQEELHAMATLKSMFLLMKNEFSEESDGTGSKEVAFFKNVAGFLQKKMDGCIDSAQKEYKMSTKSVQKMRDEVGIFESSKKAEQEPLMEAIRLGSEQAHALLEKINENKTFAFHHNFNFLKGEVKTLGSGTIVEWMFPAVVKVSEYITPFELQDLTVIPDVNFAEFVLNQRLLFTEVLVPMIKMLKESFNTAWILSEKPSSLQSFLEEYPLGGNILFSLENGVLLRPETEAILFDYIQAGTLDEEVKIKELFYTIVMGRLLDIMPDKTEQIKSDLTREFNKSSWERLQLPEQLKEGELCAKIKQGLHKLYDKFEEYVAADSFYEGTSAESVLLYYLEDDDE